MTTRILALALAIALPGTALAHERPWAHTHWAHHGAGHPPPNAMAQAAPPRDSAIQELQRQRARPGAIPWVPSQNRDAAEADAASVDDAAGLLNAAYTALRANRAGQANEFLERAESRLLTRSTLATRAGDAVQGGPVGRIAAARAALLRNDRATAQREVEAALAALDRPRRRPR